MGVLRIGFAGAGVIGWAHAIGIQAMIDAGVIDAAVVAVHDVDNSRARGFGAANGADVVSSAAEVAERCDAVWVCTPTASHRPIVEEAADRGRAVFCEKPLARDLYEARSLAAAVSERGIPAQVGLVLRFAPVFRKLRELLASGELGAPMAAVLRDDQYFPVQGIYNSTWRGDLELSGGGCLIEHSIHDLDILRFCLGEVVDISARTGNFSGHDGVEDVANVTMSFACGARAGVVSVWHEILARGSTRRLEIFCQRGTAWLDNDLTGPLYVQTDDGTEVVACTTPAWVEELPLAHDDIGLAIRAYVEEDRAFVDAIGAGSSPEPSFDEAVTAHRMVDAAYRSAASGGSPIELQLGRSL